VDAENIAVEGPFHSLRSSRNRPWMYSLMIVFGDAKKVLTDLLAAVKKG
jgi:hypothetical protein